MNKKTAKENYRALMNKKTAKEIYFDNYGNFFIMDKNGEYREYKRRNISAEIEYQWSVEIKNILMDNIAIEEEFFKIVPLSCLNLPENEIVKAFEEIIARSSREKIKQHLELLQELIPQNIYNQIILL